MTLPELDLTVSERISNIKGFYLSSLLAVNSIFISVFSGLIFLSGPNDPVFWYKAIVIVALISSLLTITVYRLTMYILSISNRSIKALIEYSKSGQPPADAPNEPDDWVERLQKRVDFLTIAAEVFFVFVICLILWLILR